MSYQEALSRMRPPEVRLASYVADIEGFYNIPIHLMSRDDKMYLENLERAINMVRNQIPSEGSE